MPGTSSLDGRTIAVAAAVLLAVAAAALLSGAGASPASGDTDDATASAREAETADYGEDRRPVPRVVKQWAAAWNAGSPERMAALFTKDGVYEDHGFQVVFRGRDGVAEWVSITTGSIDDARIEVHGAFRSGDRVAVQWTFSGTDSAGGLGGQPPTGNSFSVPAASIFKMRGDKIRRVDDYYNLADLLGQLGQPADAAEPSPAS